MLSTRAQRLAAERAEEEAAERAAALAAADEAARLAAKETADHEVWEAKGRAKARASEFLEQQGPWATVSHRHLIMAVGGTRASLVEVLAAKIDGTSTDEEIVAALRGMGPPTIDSGFSAPPDAGSVRDLWAAAAGYGSHRGYLGFKAAEDVRRRAEVEEEARRYAAERRDFVDSPLLTDLERAILDVLLGFGHKPVLPEDCWIDVETARAPGRTDDAAIRRAVGVLALLLSWHAEDQPQDLAAWMRRTYGAAVALPLAALPRDERLEALWRRYASPGVGALPRGSR